MLGSQGFSTCSYSAAPLGSKDAVSVKVGMNFLAVQLTADIYLGKSSCLEGSGSLEAATKNYIERSFLFCHHNLVFCFHRNSSRRPLDVAAIWGQFGGK